MVAACLKKRLCLRSGRLSAREIVGALSASFLFRPWGWTLWLIYPLQFLRQIVRNQGAMTDRTTLALFQLLARFPEGLGQIRFMRDRMAGRQAGLIEYK